MVTDVLVLGYGNDLRGDDAVGRRLAEAVEAWGLPGVRAASLHQLTPEVAETVSDAELVVFADASPQVQRVHLAPVVRQPSTSTGAHQVDPSTVLELAQMVYDRTPTAWMLHLPAEQFELGAALSESARAGLAEALERLRGLVDEAMPGTSRVGLTPTDHPSVFT